MVVRQFKFCLMKKTLLEFSATRNEVSYPPRRSAKTNKSKNYDTWAPLAARLYMAWPTLLAPLAVIATIEILYRISQQSHGIASVSSYQDTVAALSRILPALVMFTLATFVNSLDFTIASFAPFSLLRLGGVGAAQALSFRMLGELPPVALWRAAVAGHLPALFSSMAGITGSVLAIAASGLLVINRNVTAEVPIQAILSHSWDVKWGNSAISGDGNAGVRLNRIQHSSEEMPVTVWDNVILPEVSIIDDTLLPVAPSRCNWTLEVVALRPELVCELISTDNVYRGKVGYYEYPSQDNALFARPLLSPPCQRGGSNGSKDHVEFFAGFARAENGDQPLFAILNDLHLGPWDPSLWVIEWSEHVKNENTAQYFDNVLLPDNPAGCPSIGIGISGQGTSDDLDDRFTAFICSQKIALMRLEAAYSRNEDGTPEVSTKIAPVILDGPTDYFTNGTEGVDSFPYRVETYLASNLTYFGVPAPITEDSFFNHLIYGPNGTSFDSLIGKANRKNLLDAVQQLYGKYMSLVIDGKFRQPFPADTPQEDKIVNGTATYFTSRLQVDYGSKLALQILLGTMTLFATLAFGLSDLRGTLPRKPTSIASVMALLAGSELVQDERLRPESLQGRSVEEVLDGEIFSLGWWPVKGKDDQNGEQRSVEEFNSREGSNRSAEDASKRFGIDIGIPEQLGLRQTRAWRLRQRLKHLGRRGK